MNVYGKSNMGRLMLIGGLVGGALSFMSRETRSVWGHRVQNAAKSSGQLIQTVYQNPAQVGRYFSVTGTRLKGLAREVSDDFQHMIEHAEMARKSTGNTYQYVMEAGSELGDIAGKIKRYGQNLSQFDQPVLIDSELDALQRLENETTVPNPGTMRHESVTTATQQTNYSKGSSATATLERKKETVKTTKSVSKSGNHSKNNRK